ncbi:MAG: hypothetical protein V1851_01535 [Patescibacteria group bacterium]
MGNTEIKIKRNENFFSSVELIELFKEGVYLEKLMLKFYKDSNGQVFYEAEMEGSGNDNVLFERLMNP